MPIFRKRSFSVMRRFSDFLGLHDKLVEKYLRMGRIIPPAPEKSVIGKWYENSTARLGFPNLFSFDTVMKLESLVATCRHILTAKCIAFEYCVFNLLVVQNLWVLPPCLQNLLTCLIHCTSRKLVIHEFVSVSQMFVRARDTAFLNQTCSAWAVPLHTMKVCRRVRGIAPLILSLGISCRWVVSFMPQPLYSRGQQSWYPSSKRLGGLQASFTHSIVCLTRGL